MTKKILGKTPARALWRMAQMACWRKKKVALEAEKKSVAAQLATDWTTKGIKVGAILYNSDAKIYSVITAISAEEQTVTLTEIAGDRVAYGVLISGILSAVNNGKIFLK